MIDCIRSEFEHSSDPMTLKQLENNPLDSKDEMYGVPPMFSMFMKHIKD